MIRATFAAIALGLGLMSQGWAYRVLEQIEQAYELQLGSVTLPDNATGPVVFTPCATCRTMSLRVSERTLYLIDRELVDLPTLRTQADALRATVDGPQRVGVYVFYDPETLRVTRLRLSP